MYWHWCKRYITFFNRSPCRFGFSSPVSRVSVETVSSSSCLPQPVFDLWPFAFVRITTAIWIFTAPLQIREQGKILKNTYCGWTDWSSCWTTRPAISACRVRLSDVVFSTIHVLSTNLKVSPKLPLPASPWIKIHLPRIYSEWKNIQLGSERCEYGYNFWYFTSVCHCNCFLMKLQTIAAFNEIQKLKKRKRYCISCCEITATFLHCLTFRVSNVYNIPISSWIKCCLSNLVNLAKWD